MMNLKFILYFFILFSLQAQDSLRQFQVTPYGQPLKYWDKSKGQKSETVHLDDPQKVIETGDVIVNISDDDEDDQGILSVYSLANDVNKRYNHVAIAYKHSDGSVWLMDSSSPTFFDVPLNEKEKSYFLHQGIKASSNESLLDKINNDKNLKKQLLEMRMKDKNIFDRVYDREHFAVGLPTNFHVLRLRRDITNRSEILTEIKNHLKSLPTKNIIYNTDGCEAHMYDERFDNDLVFSRTTRENIKRDYKIEKVLEKHCTERVTDSLLIAGLRKKFNGYDFSKTYLQRIKDIRKHFGESADEKIRYFNRKLVIAVIEAFFNESEEYSNSNVDDHDQAECPQKEVDVLLKKLKNDIGPFNRVLIDSFENALNSNERDELLKSAPFKLFNKKLEGLFFPDVFMDDATIPTTFSDDNPSGGIFSYVGSRIDSNR